MPPSVATIGFFDGVHRGHRFLINQVKEVAAKDGLYSALITFPVHPRQVIQTAYRPQLLSSPMENTVHGEVLICIRNPANLKQMEYGAKVVCVS